jgi:hypothetical protein
VRTLITWIVAAALLAVTGAAGAAPRSDLEERDSWGFSSMDLDGLGHAESAHFRVWYTPEAAKGAAVLLARAEKVRERLWSELDLHETEPIRVVLLPDLPDYFHRRGITNRAPPWAIGLCISTEETLLIKWGQQASGPWVQLHPTFVHELAHLALDRATHSPELHTDGMERTTSSDRHRRRVPRWLHEGFAIRAAGEWTLERSTTLMRAGLGGSIIPLHKLHNGFPASGFGVELAYAESFHFVRFLFEEFGSPAFARMLGQIRQGQSFDTAFVTAYGQRFRLVEAQWRKDLNVAFTWIPVLTGSSAIWFAAVMAFLLAYQRQRVRMREQLAALALTEATAPPRTRMNLPGLGMTRDDTRPRRWRVLADGTWVPNTDWEPPDDRGEGES